MINIMPYIIFVSVILAENEQDESVKYLSLIYVLHLKLSYQDKT